MSGVYIKSFQLPEKSDMYYVKVECEPGKNPVATIWRKDVLGSMSFGAFECIPVPDHGRLIEEDAAYDKIAEAAGEEAGNYVDMDVAGRGLENTPTVIPASGKDINVHSKEE